MLKNSFPFDGDKWNMENASLCVCLKSLQAGGIFPFNHSYYYKVKKWKENVDKGRMDLPGSWQGGVEYKQNQVSPQNVIDWFVMQKTRRISDVFKRGMADLR